MVTSEMNFPWKYCPVSVPAFVGEHKLKQQICESRISFSIFRRLEPVTQLYVSVDASTKESLKRIDRPLFKDFWQRFLDSLKALAEKVPT